jgi:hypothetical protein
MIATTLGGYKFPDGTIQATAAVSGLERVFHDATLTGDGTSRSPLGVDPRGVVTRLNGLAGDVVLNAGANITITPSGNMLTITASGCGCGITHNGSLKGDGTAANPLSVADSLFLHQTSGTALFAITDGNQDNGVVAKGGPGGAGVDAEGGASDGSEGGYGLQSRGGDSGTHKGGRGLDARAGDSITGGGGMGIWAEGGSSIASGAGDGLHAFGGASTLGPGGVGIVASGGIGGLFNTRANAAEFFGDVEVIGYIDKFGGSFKIDHPLDPANRYLYHSFVESPDMKNIYDGNVVTNENGEAVVELPAYFEALNRDFRYQLTVIGTFAQAIVAEKISGNRFTVKTSTPNVEVSWQVTGIRQDAWANKNRIRVEVEKDERERGSYLSPEVFGQPEEKSVQWVRHPEMMQQIKEQRLKVEQMRTQKTAGR